MSVQDHKKSVGAAAALLVEDGMTVGLGTGTTAAFFVSALAERALKLICVATSKATADLAQSLGMTVVDLDAAGPIDLTIDGADEIGPHLSLIKGGGAALLREKLVWESSSRCIVIADAAKLSSRLGRFSLPVEVVAFGHARSASRVKSVLTTLRIDADPVLRRTNGAVVITDSGNVIYDVACGSIDDAVVLGAAIKAVTGVVEHGLFVGLAGKALIGTDQGVQTLLP